MDDFGWYYRDDNNQRGPVSSKEIQEFVKTGGIKRKALIWHPSLKDWPLYQKRVSWIFCRLSHPSAGSSDKYQIIQKLAPSLKTDSLTS